MTLGMFDYLILGTAVCIAVLWLWMIGRVKAIERQLDQEHDYFRYVDRGDTWVGARTIDWLRDFLRKYSSLGYEDPVLERLVTRYRTAFAIWVAAILIWAIGVMAWAVIS
ncbi:hypothetical protein [Sphingopyxis sp. NJF-3]